MILVETSTNTKPPAGKINLEYVAGFNKAFGKINVNTFVGGNQMKKSFEVFRLIGNGGFNVPFHAAINNAVSKTFDYAYEGVMINSLFASAEIAVNNYLFITGTGRKDWFLHCKKIITIFFIPPSVQVLFSPTPFQVYPKG